jgi:hypothetical protein
MSENAIRDMVKYDKRIAELEAAIVRLFNAGYAKGHDDTVEGCYVNILQCDEHSYHREIVAEMTQSSPPPEPEVCEWRKDAEETAPKFDYTATDNVSRSLPPEDGL